MTAEEQGLLEDIRGLAFANRVEFTDHARERIWERSLSETEVVNALAVSTHLRLLSDGRLRVTASDADGEDLLVIAVIEEGCLVITVY